MKDLDLNAQLHRFIPANPSEQQVRTELLALAAQEGEALLSRQRQAGHLTASGLIVDPDFTKMLMVYHNIYRSYSWTGGHADGDPDLLGVALREAREETGIQEVYPYSSNVLALDRLPVPPHEKKGVPVPAHHHYSCLLYTSRCV